jgi:cell division protein FtsB
MSPLCYTAAMTVARPPSVYPKRRRPLFSRLGLLILIGFCIFFVASYTGRLRHKAEVEREISALQLRITEAEQHQQELQAELDYVNGPAYIEDVARNQLDMAKPGDKVIVVVNHGAEAAAEAALDEPAPEGSSVDRSGLDQPTWEQWLELITGDE